MARVRVKGDLTKFPFEGERESEFRVTARVTGAELNVYPAALQSEKSAASPPIWPLLTDIDGDLLFERASMTVTAQRGAAYGAKLTNVVARIPNLEARRHARGAWRRGGPVG